MTPYPYTVIRARHPHHEGESRSIAVLALAPAQGRAWLRQSVAQRSGLIGDPAAFVRGLLTRRSRSSRRRTPRWCT
jgi:hypothetical protein